MADNTTNTNDTPVAVLDISERNYTYPHNPAWSNSSSVLQCEYEKEYHDGYYILSFTYIGPDQTIQLSGFNLHEGALIQDGDYKGKITNSKTTKIQANRTKLQCTAKIITKNTQPSPEQEEEPIEVKWSEQMGQVSFPLYRYCSPTARNGDPDFGCASLLRAWESQTDSETAVAKSEFKVLSGDTEVVLSGMTRKIAEKMAQGIEEVIRYYPTATRVSTYEKYQHGQSMSARAKALNTIDSTPNEQFHWTISWLKTNYDWTQNDDDTWTLVESWQGVQGGNTELSTGWDPNLYSGNRSVRWEFYYSPVNE